MSISRAYFEVSKCHSLLNEPGVHREMADSTDGQGKAR